MECLMSNVRQCLCLRKNQIIQNSILQLNLQMSKTEKCTLKQHEDDEHLILDKSCQPQFEMQKVDKEADYDSQQAFQNRPVKKRCNCLSCFCCFGNQMNIQRYVEMNGKTEPHNKISNALNNQKYNMLNFIPLVLFNQFKMFFNFFQLAINLSQLIPILKVGFLFTYLSPLVMVMTITLAKQAYDDFKRFKRDRQSNSTKYKTLKGNTMKTIKSANIKVGDIIQINAKERIPADIVILSTSEPTGSVFIKTDQLDGETDWKLRRAIRQTHQIFSNDKLAHIEGSITYAPACDDIYEFLGSFRGHDGKKQSLGLDNTAWANTVLAAGHILGIVIFTGKETRAMMNSRQPKTKIGKFDQEINYLSKILFLLMLILALIMNIFRQLSWLWPLYYFRYVLLLASIIPISLRVNLDLCKTYFSYKISNDPHIPQAMCRNSSIPEELGRVQYLLSDKTGTLTYNDMIFKKLSVNEHLYTSEEVEDIKKTLCGVCQKYEGPLGDMIDSDSIKKKRSQDCLLRDLATALILCNNVTPVVDDGIRVLQASSPDEIALVKFAQSVGFEMKLREKNSILIQNTIKVQESYNILANFPFSSESKRMGIIVKHKKSNKIIFYVKGADMVMKSRCKSIFQGYIQDECDNLARQGLRTLVIAQKQLSPQQYDNWNREYENASNLIKKRQEAIKKAMEVIQRQLDLVGITGVEDKLQDEVAVTIQALRMGGIKVWMLTGDKVETAKCIAISAGLKSINQSIFQIRGQDEVLIRKNLLECENSQQVLLVDGGALSSILNTNNSDLFFDVARKAPAVICCRCLPTQKAFITQKMKLITGSIVAAIGDGGNDVGMIQLASIGLGIVGKEGNQAALASDISMKEFKHTKQLLLWHGRNAYKRAAVLSQFVIHRGLIISILQMAFSIIFYNVAIPIYNGMLMLGYATLYTSLPVFSLILDEDLSLEKTLLYPNLYITLRKSRQMNIKTFFTWVWISIYQGLLIMVMSLNLFEQSFVRIVTITFSALIMSQILNVAVSIHKINRYIIGSQLLTLLIYGLSLLLLRNYLDTSKIDKEFLWKVGLIVLITWTPIYLIKCFKRRISPSQEDKITA